MSTQCRVSRFAGALCYFFPEGRTYSPPTAWAVVWPSAIVRSARQMRPLRGPTGNDCGHSRCVWNSTVRRPVPYASKNLPLAGFRCLRGTKDEGTETKDGGNRNWQFIIWRQKLSVGGQAVPPSQQQPI